jgi:hypothetical protein
MEPAAPAEARLMYCPSCSVRIPSDSIVCRSCGGVVPLEGLGRRLRHFFPELVATFLRRTNVRPADLVLWFLACVPLLMAPPILAMGMVAFQTARTAPGRRMASLPVALLCIALLNIIISAMFWIATGQRLWAVLLFVQNWIGDYLYGLKPSGSRPPVIKI